MPRNVKLLLTENVEALGIVGDVVTVRTGYARNFLLPRDLATQPSEERIKALAAKRADAEKQLAELRKHREELIEKLKGVEITLERSCNDQGILYGAVSQQDLAAILNEKGFPIKPREVRLPQAVKRIDTYDVHIKLDADLDATIKLWVVADRKLDLDKAAPDHDAGKAAEGRDAEGGDEGKAPEGKHAEGKGGKHDDKPGAKAEGKSESKPKDKPAKSKEKKEKGDKADAAESAPAAKSTGWGRVVEKPATLADFEKRGPRRK